MSKPGLGVMIQMMGGGDRGAASIASVFGEKIESLSIDEADILCIRFSTGELRLSDNGQSCCEYRHMSTDDDLEAFVGAEFRGAEVRPGPDEPEDYDYHETEFLIVHTSQGDFTIVNHNEHNGYYGGFWIQADFVASEAKS